MGIENINNQTALSEFKSMKDFINAFDADKSGSLDKSEITAAQKYFDDAGITSVSIDDIDYNLITDDDANKRGVIKGSKGNDLILSTDAKKIKGKGGDDIIIASEDTKVKGGGGEDLKITADEKVEAFGEVSDLIYQFDVDQDGAFSKEEILAAQNYFKERGVEKIVIGGKEYNLITDENVDKKGKIKGSEGDDLILSTEASTIKGKGGDDVILAADAQKIKGNNGFDYIYLTGDNAKIKGGTGKDKIHVDGNSNSVKGGWGWDDIYVNGDNNKIDGNEGGDEFYVNGNNNQINVGDWSNRSLTGKIVSFIPKVIYSCLLAIPSNISKMIAPEGQFSKDLDQHYKQIWGDFSNEVFVNGENNSVKTYFEGNVNEQKNKGIDVIYDKENANQTRKEGSFENFSSSNDPDKYRLLNYFRDWLNQKTK